jgi:hypothetical protein
VRGLSFAAEQKSLLRSRKWSGRVTNSNHVTNGDAWSVFGMVSPEYLDLAYGFLVQVVGNAV